MKVKFNFIRFLFIVFMLVVAVVALYQVYCYFYVSVATEFATVAESEETVTATGYFLRDESLVSAGDAKYIDITLNDGAKVARQGVIANVYSTENAAGIQSQIRDLQSRIDEIKTAISAAGKLGNTDAFKSEIKKNAISISAGISGDDINEALDKASAFTSSVVKNKIANGEISDYSAKLSELENSMEQLKAQSSAVTRYITAPHAGYFITKYDGLESKLSLSSADNLTAQSFSDISSLCSSSQSGNTGYIGKLVSNTQWRVCLKTDSPKLDRISAGSRVYIRIPSVANSKIKCNVVSVLNEGGNMYIVLESNVVLGDILSERSCEISLVVDTYKGLRVDKNAIRKVDGEDGVYIKSNGILKYRKVKLLYIGTTYAIVEYDRMAGSGLQAYDEVVVKGADLYDGKVI